MEEDIKKEINKIIEVVRKEREGELKEAYRDGYMSGWRSAIEETK